LDATFEHLEWARVANVTLVEAPHASVWKVLSDAVLSTDDSEKIAEILPQLRQKVPGVYAEFGDWATKSREALHAFGRDLVSNQSVTPEHLTVFASHCIDAGHEVPDDVLADPRCLL
jgi:hypothetical protein